MPRGPVGRERGAPARASEAAAAGAANDRVAGAAAGPGGAQLGASAADRQAPGDGGRERAGGAPLDPGAAGGRRGQLRALLRLGGLGLFVVVLFLVAASLFGLSSEGVRDAVDGFGPLAPVVFVAFSASLTVACVPGPLLAGAAGLLFGTALGTPTAIVSATLGATVAAAISRRFGAGALDELSGRRVSALQDWIAARGFLAVLYARILPAVPYSLVNYAAGLTRVPLAIFAAATALGCAPRAFAYVALGGSLDDLGSPEALVAFAVLVGMALVGLAFAARDVRSARAARRGA
ncbi:TVP38/TMEM64 family protein [Conexibacter arvalis]|uniref:TVP38/TMEM64 family membrane protein n=1 Tax=Conexibacter arvalis TaxID=912552 RepID=A0A840IEK7_9ACTN|nr:TVP38/TMEM64 family protein [Conexibacter arvalis]MBB4663246.1 putative membrane protein YdjX (TVP38/TMEM64 family) [Conexibacter arvalis]